MKCRLHKPAVPEMTYNINTSAMLHRTSSTRNDVQHQLHLQYYMEPAAPEMINNITTSAIPQSGLNQASTSSTRNDVVVSWFLLRLTKLSANLDSKTKSKYNNQKEDIPST